MARVLLIDDERDVLLICRLNLEFAGHEVATAAGGAEGLELARAQSPDVIVLDLMMPNTNGFDVLDALVLDVRTRGIPVVVLTAKLQREDEISSWHRGAVGFLTKPFSPDMLVQTVHRVLAMNVRARQVRRSKTLQELMAHV
jgi:DNA-binding response OmpR family regulator